MLLENKTAAVFAATGAIASSVAKAFAAQGATVYLSGRQLSEVEKLADSIQAAGGTAKAFVVDTSEESAVESFLQTAISETGQLDVVFNGIGIRAEEGGYGTPSTLLSFEQFMKPLEVHLGAQFISSRVAARLMQANNLTGTILLLTASLSRIKSPFMAGITAACTGIEGLTRSLAAEYGPSGIRVICLNPTAMPETRTIQETMQLNAKTIGIDAQIMAAQMQQASLMGKSPSTEDIGQLAAFLASETGALFNSHIVDADYGTMNVI